MRATIASLILLLVCSLQSFAQMGQFNYSSGGNFTDIDNATNQTTINTWHAVYNSPSNLTDITVAINPTKESGANGGSITVLALDSSRNVWKYSDFPANSWAQQSQYGTQMMQLVAGSSSILLGVAATGTALNTGCAGHGNELYSWNGSSWASFGACTRGAGAHGDGTYCFVDHDTYVPYFLVNGSWVAMQANGGGWQQCTAGGGNTGFLLGTDWKLYSYDSTGAISTVSMPVSQIDQIAEDFGGQIYIHPNGTGGDFGVIYRRSMDNVWHKIVIPDDMGTREISELTSLTSGDRWSTFAIFSVGSNASAYRLPPRAIQVSGTATGNGTCTGTCQITHDVTYQNAYAAKHIGNTPSVHDGPYSDFVNLQSTDTLWDPFDCMENFGTDAGCPMTTTCTIGCSATGNHDCGSGDQNGSGTTPGNPGCSVPSGGVGHWPAASNVTVYFDNKVFCNSGCPGTNVQALDIFNGINGWNTITPLNTTYTFGGTVPTSATCGTDETDHGTFNLPCGPHYPYLLVALTLNNELTSRSYPVTPLPGGDFSLTTVNYYPLEFQDDWAVTNIGAHEEGHRHGLDDCCNPNDIGNPNCTGYSFCSAFESTTVMWYNGPNDAEPKLPTTCDFANAIY